MVISYEKPDSILEDERKARASAKKEASSNGVNGMSGVNGMKGVQGAGTTAVAAGGRGRGVAATRGGEGLPECNQS